MVTKITFPYVMEEGPLTAVKNVYTESKWKLIMNKSVEAYKRDLLKLKKRKEKIAKYVVESDMLGFTIEDLQRNIEQAENCGRRSFYFNMTVL